MSPGEKIKAGLFGIVLAAVFAWSAISYIGKRADCAERGMVPVRTLFAWQWSCGKVELPA